MPAHRSGIFLLVLLFAVPTTIAVDVAAPPALVFVSNDKSVLRLTAADLAKRPAARVFEIDDPFYKRRKRYRAVPLKDLLTAAYGGSWGENALGEVFFDALDGYRSHAPVSVLMNDGGMIAFADADSPYWEKTPGKGVEPGPFYLFWTGSAQTKKNGYPWPWQITGVKMAVLEDEYPKALPKGAAPGSAAVRGWNIFRKSCISCHAVNGAGADVGPDLNEPRGITSYHNKKYLKAYILQPSAFRHTKMPDFGELTPDDLNDLMSYFDHMNVLARAK